MKLGLCDIVKTVTVNHDVSEKEIFDTVEFLIKDSVWVTPALLFKIGRMVNKEIEYEKAPL